LQLIEAAQLADQPYRFQVFRAERLAPELQRPFSMGNSVGVSALGSERLGLLCGDFKLRRGFRGAAMART
jgi:hypothetical protein